MVYGKKPRRGANAKFTTLTTQTANCRLEINEHGYQNIGTEFSDSALWKWPAHQQQSLEAKQDGPQGHSATNGFEPP